MEFDVKGRIRFFAKQIEEREYLRDIEYELGYDGYKTLCEIVEFKRKITEEEFELIKQSYLDAQKGKENAVIYAEKKISFLRRIDFGSEF